MIALGILYIVIALAAIFYLYSKWTYTYWKRRGVHSPEPELFYGNIKDQLNETVSVGDQFMRFYKEAKARGDKHIGVYMLLGKIYVPIDIEIIKNILQKDFGYFMNHGFFNVSDEVDPLSGHLFNLENEKWKNMRAKLSPTFTSGKLKMMFQTLVDCTLSLEDVMTDLSKMGDAIDIKDVGCRYTTDVIGSCAFGLECNTLKNPKSDLLYYGKKFFTPNLWIRVQTMLQLVLPRSISKFLGLKLTAEDVENFFMNIINSTVKYREENNVYRKDFLHLMIQLKNKGRVTDDESINKESNDEPPMSIDEFAAQCFGFFAAGFETSATTIAFVLLELAQNQDIQDKLREDIESTLKKHDGQMTYEAVMEMSYLNKVIYESLRKNPPVSMIPRICNKDYQIPGTDLVIEEGTLVHIPTLSIHRDPDYYPDPDKFDPERFSEENKSKQVPFTFLTFGDGPRLCIGARFGIMQVKVAIVAIIRSFRITLNEKTELPIVYETKPIVNSVKGGVWLNATKIVKN